MMRRPRRISRLELFYAAVIACVMVGGSLWLDRSGSLVSATVAGKRERIVVGYEPSGEWDRYHEVLAAFDRPDGVRSEAIVRVSPQRYDSLRGGDPIEVRYLPQFPVLARTSDRSTAIALRDFASAFAAIPIVAWLAVGVVSLWIAARLGSIPVLAVGAAWATAAWPVLFTAPSRERARPAEAMAEVRLVTLVDRSPARLIQTRTRHGRFDTRLEVPYEVVELALAAGSGDTVVAVDAVDSGSVTGLMQGAHLAVRLDPAAPREAQLVGGTRRFAEANRYHFLIPVSGCALLGTLAGLAYRGRRRKRQTTTKEATMARQGTAIAAGVLLLLLEAGSAAAQVSAGMRIPDKYAPRPTAGVLRQLVCRGKAGLHVAKEHDPSPRDGRRVTMTLTYQRNPGPAGLAYESLEPGSCSWNPGNFQGIPAEPGTVHFDLDRDGSEWVPDPGSLPAYLGDPQHFWVFYVDDLTLYSNSHGAWKERFWLPDSLRQRTHTSDAAALFDPAELPSDSAARTTTVIRSPTPTPAPTSGSVAGPLRDKPSATASSSAASTLPTDTAARRAAAVRTPTPTPAATAAGPLRGTSPGAVTPSSSRVMPTDTAPKVPDDARARSPQLRVNRVYDVRTAPGPNGVRLTFKATGAGSVGNMLGVNIYNPAGGIRVEISRTRPSWDDRERQWFYPDDLDSPWYERVRLADGGGFVAEPGGKLTDGERYYYLITVLGSDPSAAPGQRTGSFTAEIRE